MEEILKYLGAGATFFLATQDGDQPRVRPFGFAMDFNNKLYFVTGNQKDVFRQLKENPKCEICAMASDGSWLRVSGEAVFDGNLDAKKKSILDFLSCITGGNSNLSLLTNIL